MALSRRSLWRTPSGDPDALPSVLNVIACHPSHSPHTFDLAVLVTLPLSALPRVSRSMTRSPNVPALTLQYSAAAISTDLEHSHHAWAQQACSLVGSGPTCAFGCFRAASCAWRVGCLVEDKGITFHASYLSTPQITMNELPVGRSARSCVLCRRSSSL